MNRSVLLLISLLMLAISPLNAKTVEVTQAATGFGETPQTATANALVEAARQALGVSVLADPKFRVATYEWIVDENFATGEWTTVPEAQALSLANVAGYQVLKTTKVEDELWQADIEARLYKDESLLEGREDLPTVVVTPFQTAKQAYYPGVSESAVTVRRNLQAALTNAFVQSGRVRVLDRKADAAVLEENMIVASGLSAKEQAKLGQQLGADLVLVGEIEEFKLGRENEQFYGAKLNTMEPVVRVHYRLIETSTREVIQAGTYDAKGSKRSLLQELRDAGIDKDRDPGRIGEVLYPRVAAQLTGEVMDTLYPVRILSAQSEEQVFISQGSGRIQLGDLLSVHAPAGEAVDPDTGATITLQSPSVATLKVTSVENQYAVAGLKEGELTALGVNMVVRSLPPEDPPLGKGKPMTPGSTETPWSW